MIELSPIREAHAEALFPLVFRSSITDTLIWDGPESLQELKTILRDHEEKTTSGLLHAFAIISVSDGVPIGTIRIAPDSAGASGEIGLWIGSQFQGRGYGTESVSRLLWVAFENLALERLEARVFVGNLASRRIFEKNGFILEGTVPRAVRKRGALMDEWVFRLDRDNYGKLQLHLKL
jgi:RimJ/RimL family protein N-acetyltransferase